MADEKEFSGGFAPKSERSLTYEEAFGVKLPSRTWGQAAKDVGAGLAGGVARLVKTGGDVYGLATGRMDNVVSHYGDKAQSYFDDSKSAQLRDKIEARSQRIDEADSVLGKAWTAAADTLTDPALALDTLASNAASLLPGAAAGRAAAAAKYARGLQAASKAGPASMATREAIAKSAGTFGTGAAIGTGAVQQAGDVAGGEYQQLMKQSDKAWADNPLYQAALQRHGGDAQAAKHELALASARGAFPGAFGVSVATNAIPGATYLERALVGAPLRQGAAQAGRFAAARAVGKGILGEAAQETIEEGGGQMAANLSAQRNADAGRDTWDGVGEAAGMGFAGGALMGIGGGVSQARQVGRDGRRVEDVGDDSGQTRPSETMGLRSGPEAGALEGAAARAVDAQAVPEAALPQAAHQVEQQQEPQSDAAPAPTYMPGPAVNANREKAQPQVVLQNRDRSSAASVAQMTNIAANPDFLRVGPSTEMTTGAPVVFGTVPDGAVIGRVETVVDGKDDRIQTQYAVVDAGDVIASNNADGTTVGEYVEGLPGKLRAVAGNGRTAGLQKAYQQGTASQYKQDLVAAAENMGLDAGAIEAMQNPVLVRVMDSADVRDDMGDRTNISGTQRLSPVEQAGNDARRLNLADLVFDENGTPTQETLHQFINTMPDAEKGDLIAGKNGAPTRQAVERLMAAVFKQAYNSDELVDLYAQAREPEARAVLNAAAQAAGSLSALQEMNADFDVRKPVADAVKMAVNAARQGMPLAEFAQNADLDTHPDAFAVAQFLGRYANKPRQLADGFRTWAQDVLGQAAIDRQNQSQGGLFGAKPTLTRQQLFERLGNANANDEVGTMAREALAQRQAEKVAAQEEQAKQAAQQPAQEAQQPATQEAEGFTLTQQTPEELQALHEQQQAAQAQEAAQQQAVEDKAQADAQRDSFTLTGSDRPADANPNQADLLDAPVQPQVEAQQPKPKPKSLKEGIKQAQEKRAKKPTPKPAAENTDATEQTPSEVGGTAIEQIKSMGMEDIESLFDEAAGEGNAVETSKPVEKRSTKGKTSTGKARPKAKIAPAEKIDAQSQEDTERTAAAIAKSMGANLSDAGMNALQGLAANPDAAGTVEREGLSVISHTTKTGKVIRGIVKKDITLSEAKEIDPYTFKKNGGFFIREVYLKPSRASSNPQPKTPITQIRAAIQKAYGNLLQKLETKGLVSLVQTEAEAIEAAARARADKTGQPVAEVLKSLRDSVAYQKVWHGTPYRGIEQQGFELNKIGTGEGAQAYGWGIYFAGKREVAEGYRKTLSAKHGVNPSVVLDGQRYENPANQGWYTNDGDFADTPIQLAADWMHGRDMPTQEDIDRAVADGDDFVTWGSNSEAELEDVLTAWEVYDEMEFGEDGQLYSANIPEDSDLLDWDKPLTEQPQKVREAVGSAYNAALNKPGGHKLRKDPSGMQFYEWLSTTKGGPQQSSEYLQSLGIPGLRYLDGNSRADGQGSHNYVIWDEALLTPEAAQIDIHYSKNGGIEGFFDPQSGQSFLVADNLSAQSAPGTLMHEIGIHMAADKDSKTAKLIEQAGALRKRLAANAYVKQAEARMAEAGETSNEEFVAYLVTQYENERAAMPLSLRKLVQDFMAAVRAWMFKRGLMLKTSQLTPADIAAVARANAKAMAKGEGAVGARGKEVRHSLADAEVRGLVEQYANVDGAPTAAQIREAVQQYRDTEKALGGSEAYEKAKGAGETKLNYGQWVQVRTPNFKEWFGDWESDPKNASKVVDPETGEPLVVYHGTTADITSFMPEGGGTRGGAQKALDAFRRAKSRNEKFGYMNFRAGSFFSPSADYAGNYAHQEGAAMYPVFISAVSPVRFSQTEHRAVSGPKGVTPDALLMVDGETINEISVIDPTQIKSATGNVGTFSEASADLRFSRAAAVADAAERLAGRVDAATQDTHTIPSSWTPEQQAAAGKFATFAPREPLADRVRTMREVTGKRLAQKVFDQYRSLKDLSVKGYMQAHLARGSETTLDAVLRHGIPELRDGAVAIKADTKGFIETLKKLGSQEEVNRFLMYVTAQRANALMQEGRENLFTPEDINAMLQFAEGKNSKGQVRRLLYAQAQKEMNQFQKAMLDIGEEAGIVNAESRADWESDFYIPFYRVMEDKDGNPTTRFGMSDTGLMRQEVIKRLKGGTENLGDPLNNLMANWSKMLEASMQNMAANNSLGAATNMGIAQKVPKQQAADGTMWTLQDGKRVYWDVADKDVLESLNAINFRGYNNAFMKAAGVFKRVLTTGVTISPTFRIRSATRDILHALAVADVGYNPLKNAVEGWKQTGKDSELMKQMMAGGAAISFGLATEGRHGDMLRKRMRQEIGDDQILDTKDKFVSAFGKAYRNYMELGDRMENNSRVAAYQRAMEKTGDHLIASFEGRDIMNFTSMGSSTAVRALAQVLPFFNARLQGLYKLGRGAKNDPRRFASVVGTIGMASALLYMMQADDDEYKALPDYVRDTYWPVKMGDKWFYIPKPFEVGSMATVIERFTELAVAGDDYKARDFRDTVVSILVNNLEMNPVPQIILPAAEAWYNYDMFRGQAIDSMAMERLMPGDRYNANTSAGAVALGRAMNVSPQKLEHMVNGYFGWLGMQALSVSDLMGRTMMDLPSSTRRDMSQTNNWFIVGDFLKESGGSANKYSERFYNVQRDIEQIYATANHARHVGDMERYQELISQPKMAARGALKFADKQISRINQQVRAVIADRNLSAADKNAQLSQLYERRRQVAKQADEAARRGS